MAKPIRAFVLAAGVFTFLIGCVGPCDCVQYEEAVGYHYRCAYFKDGYCQRTEATPYTYQRCVKCANPADSPS